MVHNMEIKRQLFQFGTFFQLHQFLRLWLKDKVIILMYHGFTDQDGHEGIENNQGKHIHIEKFGAQVKFLKENYNVLPLNQVVSYLATGKKLPPWPVVLTFDDGYRSNYSLAYPILKEFGVPATIFLATDFIESNEWLWTDRVEYAIDKGKFPGSSPSSESKKMLDRKIRLELKGIRQELRSEKVEDLESRQGASLSEERPSSEIYRPLSWEEVRGMIQSGLVSVGNHTHTHVILTRCDLETIEEELRLSEEIIEKRTGVRCQLFCYPNGEIGDFDERTKKILKDRGYSCALTTLPGFNDPYSDPLELKRFGVSNHMDWSEFVMTLCGFKKFLSDLKKWALRC